MGLFYNRRGRPCTVSEIVLSKPELRRVSPEMSKPASLVKAGRAFQAVVDGSGSSAEGLAFYLKFACAAVFAPIVRLHAGLVPLQAPVHPVNFADPAGVAVSVKTVP